MLAAVLHRVAGCPQPPRRGLFFDVSPRSYCAQAADWCACQGILPGLGQGRFFPGRAVSWEELLLALWRWEGCPGGGEAPGEIWARARGFALPEDLYRPLSRGEAAQAVDSFFLPQ